MMTQARDLFHRSSGVLLALVLALVAILVFVVAAIAHECPAGVPKCKVITVTPEEEQVLAAPGGIFEIAEKGAFITLSGPIRYWREKLEKAPAGDPAKPVPEKK